jgi:hypothetical protein
MMHASVQSPQWKTGVWAMAKANGAVLWRGASLIDGAPIVVIATGLASGSSNRNTGAMVQTYILRADVSPTDAVRTGADVSICGKCPHRGKAIDSPVLYQEAGMRADGPHTARTCYVNVGQGPLGVWRAWKRGRYPDYSELGPYRAIVGQGRLVRLGTYGDPAAVPVQVWQHVLIGATGHTGYTHNWKRCDPALRMLCMASADTIEEAQAAQALGWRTFRVSMRCADSAPLRNESVCPASKEAGKKLQCAQYLACAGADGRKGSITIQGHGGFAIMANIRKLSNARPQE